MIKFELGGYYIDENNNRVQLPLIRTASINELVNYLEQFKSHNGVLVLENDRENNNEPYKMNLYSDNCRYMIMLETLMEDGDIGVRTLNNGSGSRGFIPILGEPYAEASIVQDFSLIVSVFKEFYEIGDVSRELLD